VEDSKDNIDIFDMTRGKLNNSQAFFI